MSKINLKSTEEIEIMKEGGKILGTIKNKVAKVVKPGVSAWKIEELTTSLIEKSGAKPSFKMVPGYSWSTCINVNDGVVHGIPKKETIFKEGDVVSIDLGVFYKGFHTDTALTVYLGKDKKTQKFLETGRHALKDAIKVAKIGKSVKDISETIEKILKEEGYSPIKALTGHGVGRNLHEDPAIPCYVSGPSLEKTKLVEGLVIAIEIMYSEGKGDLVMEEDGWTIRTKDAKMAALFEESVAVTKNGPIVLTHA